MINDLNKDGSEVVRVLEFPESVRMKHGMYVDSDSPDGLLREVTDNSTDEILACKTCNLIIVDTKDYSGFNIVADNGRGIPIFMSPDRENMTQADLALSTLHAGTKLISGTSTTVGTYGIGVAATNALSSDFICLSKITPENYDKSLPVVKSFYESLGPRSKKEIFYYVYYQKGYKVSEGAGKRADIEKMIGLVKPLPEGMSTITAFKVDTEIFPNPKINIPIENLENFLFIQEKFYKRKVQIVANGEVLTAASIKPYQFEILRTITPADISKNPYIGVYATFEIDPGLAPKKSTGSVNGLVVNSGVHIQYIEQCFEEALREEYKIKHKTIFPGLKLWVVMLVEDPVYDSQVKSRLRSITKVKASDFQDIVKDFIKVFRKNEDYWIQHVNKLNALAESYRSIGAVEKAQKIIDSASGNNAFKAKGEYIEGFSDSVSNDRWNCELFLCFTGETEMLTCNNERISMIDLEKRVSDGEEIYTFSCKPNGTIIPAKVLKAKKIKEVNKLCKITLDNGESFRCTLDHKLMMRDGTYKEAKNLVSGDSMMPCYITSSDKFDGEKRPVILDLSKKEPSGGYYRNDEVSLGYGGKLIPIYHIMSTHKDVIVDESSVGLTKNVNRHHIDGNKFNDSPRNLMLCSWRKHFSFHCLDNALKLHELAHKDPELYKKIYIDNKNTESFREKASKSHRDFYSSEKGDKMRDHLKEKANEEWSDENLRKWRSEETRKYAKEHPEWVKENTEKSKRIQYETTNSEILNRLSKKNLEFNSYNYNLELLRYRFENIDKKIVSGGYEAVKNRYPELVMDIIKSENDDLVFVLSKEVLKILEIKSMEVTEKNFNRELVAFGYPTRDNGSLKTMFKGTCFGYRSSKSKYPDLFAKYEAKLNNNHKIINVEFLEVEKESVYCLEVDTEEHNFPLAAGIFAKNCEGLSAGSGLKAGRKSSLYHAVLPLRGKILNVKDSSVDEALANKEIFTMLKSIGLGIDVHNVTTGCQTPEEAYEKIKKQARFGKIILAVDAD